MSVLYTPAEAGAKAAVSTAAGNSPLSGEILYWHWEAPASLR